MNDEGARQRQCAGKKQFNTLRQAKRELRHWNGSPASGLKNLHAYRCPWCVAFHIGARRRHDRAKPERFALVVPETRIPFSSSIRH